MQQDIETSSRNRCQWVDLFKLEYVAYHDKEWGVPVHDDPTLFEFLVLESMQAGLSWYTILRKRCHLRTAFKGFDPEKVARFTQSDVERLLKNPGIIRNRKKIEATVQNARAFLAVQEAFGTFDPYIWRFVNDRPVMHHYHTTAEYPTQSPESRAMHHDLHQRGFRFFGPTTCYALMQAIGMVNDHVVTCFRHRELYYER